MTLSYFKERFRSDDAEIVVLSEHVATAGDDSDSFYSYGIVNGELYSLSMVAPAIPSTSGQTRTREGSRVVLSRYAAESDGFALSDSRIIGPGANPRFVTNGERGYGLLTGAASTEEEVLLYDVVDSRLTALTGHPADLANGNWWQPFFRGNELYVVSSMSPFRVLRVDVETGRVGVVSDNDLCFNMPDFEMCGSILKGSANALTIDDGSVCGLGVAVSQSYRHYPYFWSAKDDARIVVSFTPFFGSLCEAGFNVIDPTCLFFHEGDLFFGLCCSERERGHSQVIVNALLRLRDSETHTPLRKWNEYVGAVSATKTHGEPNLDRHLFFCSEQPGRLGSRHEGGARVGKFQTPGHLIYGPYLEIRGERQYCAELSYSVRSSPDEFAGTFDVVAVSEDFETLGSARLRGTHGRLERQRIRFDSTGQLGKRLEMRVHVEAGVELWAFHIRTWLTDPNHHTSDAFPWAPRHLTLPKARTPK